MAETRGGTSTRKRTRARGHKHAKAHLHEKAPPREGTPARRELNPGMRARLRWLRLAAAGGMAAASFRQRASRSVRRWQDSPQCVLHWSAMARYSPKAFPVIQPWQDFHLMHPQRSLGQKKRPFMAKYRHYASKMRWFWQDSRAVYPKSPANRCLGIHCVKFLLGRAPNSVRGLQIIHSAHILPS